MDNRIRITINTEHDEQFVYLSDMYVSAEIFDMIGDEDFYLAIASHITGYKPDAIFLCPEDGPEYDRWNRIQEEGYYADRAREEEQEFGRFGDVWDEEAYLASIPADHPF